MTLGPLVESDGIDQTVQDSDEKVRAEAAEERRGGRSPGAVAWARLRHDKVAVVSAVIVLLFLLVAVFAPLLVALEGGELNVFHPELIDRSTTLPNIGVTANHWFGVEPRTGRDLFAIWAYGARPSLEIGFIAAISSTVVGIIIGLLAGYLGGITDRVVSWVIDLFLSLPYLLLVFAVVPIVQNRVGGGQILSAEETSSVRFWVLLVILVLFGWIGLARLIRGEVFSLRERDFVQAAKVLGVPTRQIVFKEILPNLVGPIIVSASIAVPAYITAEATLSFLGAGLVEPTPSWGRTISVASGGVYFKVYPLFIWPSVIGVALLVLALSLLGESIRDAFDPNTRR